MPALKIMGFDGLTPRESPTMLGDSKAQQADNVKLYARELRYWRGSSLAFSPAIGSIQSIYKYYASVAGPYWLTWTNDVDVVQSLTTDTTDYRYYYTGDGVPKKANETLTSTGSGAYPRGWYNLGVPAPSAAATAATVRTGVTVTMTIAPPGVVTWAAHGFAAGATVEFTTSGALPTGLVVSTKYYVRNITTDTFELGTTSTATTSITTTGTQSGTHKGYDDRNPTTVAYVYTQVSTFGAVKEESAPSAATTLLTQYTGDTVTINGFAAAPGGANYNITARRIYRSVTGATTDTYLFVTELPVATASYSDSLTAAQLGSALPTLGWITPPTDLAGLVAMPGGSLAGFSGNTVYFSEPFYPHAWPLAYALNIPAKIVGLGIFGTSVVVMTDRYPYVISGGVPGSMSVERLPTLEPCVAKRSITSNDAGVLYASPNGLVGVGPALRGVTTNALFRRDEWQAVSPNNIQAVVLDGKYFATFASSSYQSLVLSHDDIPSLSKIALQASAVHVDSANGSLYYCAVLDGKIYQLDADDLNPLIYTWKSKRFVVPRATTFSALKVDGDFGQVALIAAYTAQLAALAAANATLFSGDLLGAMNSAAVDVYDVDGSILANLPPTASARSAQVSIYGDGTLRAVLTMTSFDPVRIPPFKSRDIEIVITGNINIRSVALATTVVELHQ